MTAFLTFKNNGNDRIWLPKLGFGDIGRRFYDHPEHRSEPSLNAEPRKKAAGSQAQLRAAARAGRGGREWHGTAGARGGSMTNCSRRL